MHDPVDVLAGIEAHIRHHAGEENVRWRSQLADGDVLPFEVPDGADPLGPEQLEAADVHPAQDRDRVTRVDMHDQYRGKVIADVGRAGGQTFVEPAGLLVADIVHLSEALGAEELFRHVLGGQTKAEAVMHSEPRPLGGRFRGCRSGEQAREPHCARERQPAQESSPARRSDVLKTHRNSSFKSC